MAEFRAAPSWPGRVAAAHTISVPVLLVTGANSADPAKPYAEVMARSCPNARIMVLDGHEHVADVLDPALFASRFLPFLQNTCAEEDRS